MANETNLPAVAEQDRAIVAAGEQDDAEVFRRGPSLALRIWFDDNLYNRCKNIAKHMAHATGFTPKHLIGQPEACFAVVTRALTWRLDPHAVAMSTYQTPGGQIGFEGKLIQAILENSGKLVGGVKFKHYGDWSRVKGKFQIRKNDRQKEFPARTWTIEDARGLGVTVSAQVKGETEPRTLDFNLDTAFPLNSTLWATRPEQQICYTAVRAFASLCAPGLLMGVPFDGDDGLDMVDVSPMRDVPIDEPRRDQYRIAPAADDAGDGSDDGEETVDPDTGEVTSGGQGGQQSLGLGDKPVNYAIAVPTRKGADGKPQPDWLGWVEAMREALKGLGSDAEVQTLRDTNRGLMESLFKADEALAQELIGDLADRESELAAREKREG